MADLVLLRLADLRIGARVRRSGGIGDEGRVIAEPARAARPLDQMALTTRLEDMLGPIGFDQRQRTDVVSAPLVSGCRNLGQQLLQILLVTRALAAVPCRVDAGTAAERHGTDPGVIGDRRLAGRLVDGTGLVERDRSKALAILRRQLDPLRQAL